MSTGMNRVTDGDPIDNLPRKKCFIISPIGKGDSQERKSADRFRKLIVEDIMSKDYDVTRADDISGPSIIFHKIVEAIDKSDIIVADLSGNNPNVYYELGIAHSLGKTVIPFMSPCGTVLPFDIASIKTIFYDFDYETAVSAKRELENCLKDLKGISSNPVSLAFSQINVLNRIYGNKDTDNSEPSDKSKDMFLMVLQELNSLGVSINELKRDRCHSSANNSPSPFSKKDPEFFFDQELKEIEKEFHELHFVTNTMKMNGAENTQEYYDLDRRLRLLEEKYKQTLRMATVREWSF